MKKLMMTKHNSNTGKKRYRFLASLLAVVFMLGCMLIPDTEAKASSLALGVSASSVKIGDTVTVSITVPAGVSATVNVTYPTGVFSFSSASDTANANGGTVSMTIGSYGSTNTKTTGTMKFKAKAAGSATFSASAPIAGNQDGDRVTVSGASASVRVKNESNDSNTNNSNNSNNSNNNNNNNSNSGNGNDNNADNEDDNTKKSADNSLSSLTLSAGKLSPAFKYNVTSYTAEVDNDVTSVVVSAKPSNAKATVESVKGGENLAVGSNTIQIVVKAENGVTATYTIKVTRKEAGAADEPDEPDAQEPDNTDTPQEQCYEIGGVKMYPSEDGDETQIPEGFALSEITLWDQTYPYWVNDTIGTEVGLIYLVDENKENGAWYRISAASLYEAHPFVCFKSEFGYIIATPEKMTEAAPDGFSAETVNIEGKGIVDAYVKAGDENSILLYAVNQDGAYGLYRYDMQDRTYMRYNEQAPAEEDTQVTEPTAQPDNSKVSDLESQNRLIFYAFIVVVGILLIVIVILVVKRRRDDDDDDDDSDDVWDDDDDDFDAQNGKRSELDVAESVENESDLSDEHGGIRKRYDRSAFLTGDADASDKKDDEAVAKEETVSEPAKTPVTTNTLDLEAVLAEAVAETMNDGAGADAKKSDVSVGKSEEDTDQKTSRNEETAEEEVIGEDPVEEPMPAKRRKKKSYREEIEESMDEFDLDEDEDDFDFDDDEEDEEKPKKKKERRGLFGRRKKKKKDEDEDLEFLDL